MANLTVSAVPLRNEAIVSDAKALIAQPLATPMNTAVLSKAAAISERFSNITDLQGRRLSYGNGVKNIVGMRKTGMSIRMRIVNDISSDQKIYIHPFQLLGILAPTASNQLFQTNLYEFIGLDENAHPWYLQEKTVTENEGEENEAETKLTVKSLNSFHNLMILASLAAHEPFNIVGISMRSFKTDGTPENTNYGNSITHYNVSAWREKRRQNQLDFSQFQTSRDFSTEILAIDFVNANFIAPVSQADVLELLINANTRMDITLHVGARASGTELFFRDIQAGTDLLLNNFDGSVVNTGI
jgi:hypothetical protein